MTELAAGRRRVASRQYLDHHAGGSAVRSLLPLIGALQKRAAFMRMRQERSQRLGASQSWRDGIPALVRDIDQRTAELQAAKIELSAGAAASGPIRAAEHALEGLAKMVTGFDCEPPP